MSGVVGESTADNTSWLWRNSLEKSNLRSWPSVYYSRGGAVRGGRRNKGEGTEEDRRDEKVEEGGGGGGAAVVAAATGNDPIYAVIDKHRRRRNNNIDGILTRNFAHADEQQGSRTWRENNFQYSFSSFIIWLKYVPSKIADELAANAPARALPLPPHHVDIERIVVVVVVVVLEQQQHVRDRHRPPPPPPPAAGAAPAASARRASQPRLLRLALLQRLHRVGHVRLRLLAAGQQRRPNKAGGGERLQLAGDRGQHDAVLGRVAVLLSDEYCSGDEEPILSRRANQYE